MASRFNYLIYSLLILQITSNLYLISAATYESQPKLDPLTTREVTLKDGKIFVIPLTYTRDGNLIVSATKCGGDATLFALTSTFDIITAEKASLKWTSIGDSLTKTSQKVALNDESSGQAYLLVKLAKVIDDDSYSTVQFRTSLANTTISPDNVFSVPKNVQIEWEWNSELKKMVGSWPILSTDSASYEELIGQGGENLSVTYEMIATTSEGVSKCNLKTKTGSGLIRSEKEFKFPSELTNIAFELEPKEKIYFLTLIATVSKPTLNNNSKKSWEVQYIYPTQKYEVPAQYLPGAKLPSKSEETTTPAKEPETKPVSPVTTTTPELTNSTQNQPELTTTQQNETQNNTAAESNASVSNNTEEINTNTSSSETGVTEPVSTPVSSGEGKTSQETSGEGGNEQTAKPEGKEEAQPKGEEKEAKQDGQKHSFNTTSIVFLGVVVVLLLIAFAKLRQNRGEHTQPKQQQQKRRNNNIDLENSSTYFELSGRRSRY